jgi:hypothetical protein
LRHNLYTCCRCGKEQRTPAHSEDVPLGWAQVIFRRDYVEAIDGDKQYQQQHLTTHACASCCPEVHAYLDRVTAVDQAFDDGGVS